MQRELPKIDFVTQAEVRSKAEHRRAEEIAGLLRLMFGRWTTRFQRRGATPHFGAVQCAPVSFAPVNRGLSQGHS